MARYVVVVTSHGDVTAVNRVRLGLLRRWFGVAVEIPGEPEPERSTG
jgi:hypothetical protein